MSFVHFQLRSMCQCHRRFAATTAAIAAPAVVVFFVQIHLNFIYHN